MRETFRNVTNTHLNIRGETEERSHEHVAEPPGDGKPRLHVPIFTNLPHVYIVYFPAHPGATLS